MIEIGDSIHVVSLSRRVWCDMTDVTFEHMNTWWLVEVKVKFKVSLVVPSAAYNLLKNVLRIPYVHALSYCAQIT